MNLLAEDEASLKGLEFYLVATCEVAFLLFSSLTDFYTLYLLEGVTF